MDKHKKILILIFIITLAFRLYFAFQTPNYDYDAYFNIKQISHITDTGLPLFTDLLSYGGRTLIFSPIFHYLIAVFNFLIPSILVFKILPNLFASSLIFIIYLIAKKLTNNINIALLTSFVSAFIPIYITETLNSISAYSLAIPLIFLAIYLIMIIEKKKYINYLIAIILILPLIHSVAFLLIIGLLFYLLLTKLENLKQNKTEMEVILFSIFLVIWIQFLIFKKAFLLHGPQVIWQNTPPNILSIFFETDIFLAIINIGLIPLICGIYIIYKYLLREKNREVYLILGFALSVGLLLLLKLIQLTIGLMFLGIILTLLFAKFYQMFLMRIKRTKFIVYKKQILALFVLLFILTSVVPSYYAAKQKVADVPSVHETEALLWIEENSNKNDVVLGALKQGHIITFISERKNVIDSNFLLAINPSQRQQDVERIFKTQYKTEAVSLLNKYDVKYLLVSPNTKSEFNIEKIKYIDDEECFIPVFHKKDVYVFESVCRLEEVR